MSGIFCVTYILQKNISLYGSIQILHTSYKMLSWRKY